MKELPPPNIDSLITTVRGQKAILDADLAKIYGVPTKALNQAVKRNRDKFPEDFLFQLTPQEAQEARRPLPVSAVPEVASNRSQIVTGSQKHRDPRYLPYAFTERGAIMAANVLNSRRAVQMSVFVVRAFVKMRSAFKDSRELAQKLAVLENELKTRLDVHEAAIVDIGQLWRSCINPTHRGADTTPSELISLVLTRPQGSPLARADNPGLSDSIPLGLGWPAEHACSVAVAELDSITCIC